MGKVTLTLSVDIPAEVTEADAQRWAIGWLESLMVAAQVHEVNEAVKLAAGGKIIYESFYLSTIKRIDDATETIQAV